MFSAITMTITTAETTPVATTDAAVTAAVTKSLTSPLFPHETGVFLRKLSFGSLWCIRTISLYL